MKCELCSKPATDIHHLFSKTKLNKKMYPDYIHDKRNFMYLCNDCHLNKFIPKLTEIEFCEIMGILPRTKSGKTAYNKMQKS